MVMVMIVSVVVAVASMVVAVSLRPCSSTGVGF